MYATTDFYTKYTKLFTQTTHIWLVIAINVQVKNLIRIYVLITNNLWLNNIFCTWLPNEQRFLLNEFDIK